jgi:hypothetical protein
MQVKGPRQKAACYHGLNIKQRNGTASSLGFLIVSWQVSHEKDTILASGFELKKIVDRRKLE